MSAVQEREIYNWAIGEQAAGLQKRRTVADLLRLTEGRAAVRRCLATGKSYSAETDALARRPVVKQALALLRTREQRAEARQAAQQDMNPDRIIRLGQTRQRERRDNLLSRTRAAVTAAAEGGLYRISQSSWAGGEHTTHVRFGIPSASGESHRAWSRNGKWSGSDSEHTFVVPETWLADVQERGLAVVGGMLTLAAEPVDDVDGVEIFRASWVKQGRGFDLNVVHGYLARCCAVAPIVRGKDPKRAARAARKAAADDAEAQVTVAVRKARGSDQVVSAILSRPGTDEWLILVDRLLELGADDLAEQVRQTVETQ